MNRRAIYARIWRGGFLGKDSISGIYSVDLRTHTYECPIHFSIIVSGKRDNNGVLLRLQMFHIHFLFYSQNHSKLGGYHSHSGDEVAEAQCSSVFAGGCRPRECWAGVLSGGRVNALALRYITSCINYTQTSLPGLLVAVIGLSLLLKFLKPMPASIRCI